MSIFRKSWKNRSKPRVLLDRSNNLRRSAEKETGGSRCLSKVQWMAKGLHDQRQFVWYDSTSYANLNDQCSLAWRYWNFPELQEATVTTKDIYSGHLKSLLEEWATLSGWQQLCKRTTPATMWTGKCGRAHVYRLFQTQTFHCPCSMLAGHAAVWNLYSSQCGQRRWGCQP